MIIESFPIQTRVFDPDSKLDDSPAAVKLRYEQNADTNGFTDAEKAKLGGVATGATANAPDAELRDRATHTGAQAVGTITGLQAALDGKAAAAHTHALANLTQSGATTGQVPKWNGSAWAPADDAAGGGGGVLNNFAATAAPTVNDDSGDGFAVGSVWIVVSGAEAGNVYRCKSATVGAADWDLVFDDASAANAADQAALDDADKVLVFALGAGDAPVLVPGSVFARRLLSINAQTGTTYTITANEADVVTMANAAANTLTLPANASVAIPVGRAVAVIMKGAGVTTVAGATGVTVNGVSGGSVSIAGQWKTVTALKIATNEWIVQGAVA